VMAQRAKTVGRRIRGQGPLLSAVRWLESTEPCVGS
jgi:hypothetical protein